MNVRLITFSCPLGHEAKYFRDIGLTSRMEIYVSWICLVCKTKCYSTKPIEECIADCAAEAPEEFTEEDISVLHAMKIGLPK